MRVLVVEDDLDIQRGLIQTLKDCGFIVDAVEDGVEGLYRARNWNYDAIILDIMLPGMDGWTFLEHLRKEKGTPVLMLTARNEVDDRVRGLDAGADDYLVKPYAPSELQARVRALVRRASGMSNNCIELGRVRIDLDSQIAFLDSEEVDLTGGQFRILVYLAKRAGAVVSRGELSDAMDASDEEKFSNVLDVQIYNIRKKLGKDFLQNRRGLGYVIPKAESRQA